MGRDLGQGEGRAIAAPGVGDSQIAAAPGIGDLRELEDACDEIRGLRLIDDLFMRVCLKDRTECLELIAQVVLDDDAIRLANVDGQADLPSLQGRSASLDFLCEDGEGRLVNIEVESTPNRFPPRRARFYSSALDVWSLPKGADFDELPDSLLVVLLGGDPVGDGLQAHTFRRVAEENGSPFGDGSVIIYVDCTKQDDSPLGRLAHDMMCPDPDEMYYPQLAQRAREVKLSRRDDAMNVLVRMYEKGVAEGKAAGKAEGVAEGKAEGREDAFVSLVRKGVITASEAARELGVDEGRIAQLAAAQPASAHAVV